MGAHGVHGDFGCPLGGEHEHAGGDAAEGNALAAVFFRMWDYYNNTGTGILLSNGGFVPMYALCLLPIALYMLLIFIDSSIKNKSVVIGFLSVEAAFVQLMGYGFGFLKAWWLRCVQGKDEFTAFEKNFYD